MSPNAEQARLGLVERALCAARLIADPRHELGQRARARLPAMSGLSAEGVELALSAYLETHPSEAELRALLKNAAPREAEAISRVHIVSAANVCTAALRAIAFALARSPIVRVKPSRRDPVLAELLVEALAQDKVFEALGGSIECVETISAAPGDEIHVYGSDATVEALRAQTGARIRMLGFGSGFGIALISRSADENKAGPALARDIFVFDQRGCLSPRVLLIEGDSRRALDICEALHEALLQTPVPRGRLDEGAEAELSLYRAAMEAVGRSWAGPEHLIGLDESPSPRALLLPPPLRALHALRVDAGAISRLIAAIRSSVTTVGVDELEGELAQALFLECPKARRAYLGQMQKPPLDGPVDLRLFPA